MNNNKEASTATKTINERQQCIFSLLDVTALKSNDKINCIGVATRNANLRTSANKTQQLQIRIAQIWNQQLYSLNIYIISGLRDLDRPHRCINQGDIICLHNLSIYQDSSSEISGRLFETTTFNRNQRIKLSNFTVYSSTGLLQFVAGGSEVCPCNTKELISKGWTKQSGLVVSKLKEESTVKRNIAEQFENDSKVQPQPAPELICCTTNYNMKQLFTPIKSIWASPHRNMKYRVRAKVTGFEPSLIEQFTYYTCSHCQYEGESNPSARCNQCDKQDSLVYSFRFMLFLADNTEQLPVILVGRNAQEFLSIPPTNLYTNNTLLKLVTGKLNIMMRSNVYVDVCIYSYEPAITPSMSLAIEDYHAAAAKRLSDRLEQASGIQPLKLLDIGSFRNSFTRSNDNVEEPYALTKIVRCFQLFDSMYFFVDNNC